MSMVTRLEIKLALCQQRAHQAQLCYERNKRRKEQAERDYRDAVVEMANAEYELTSMDAAITRILSGEG